VTSPRPMPLEQGRQPAATDAASAPARPHSLAFATNLALVTHALYAALLATGSVQLAHRYLFPACHLLACCVLVGSHVMLHQYPGTLSRSRFPGQEHLDPFAILIGHEVKHLLPLVLLHGVDAAWPGAAPSPTTATVTAITVLAACGYYLWQRRDNPYRIPRARFRQAWGIGLSGGITIHLLLLWGPALAAR